MMSFNHFSGKAEIERSSDFENFMSCLFVETYITLLIHFVKQVHSSLCCELHFL